MQSKIFLFKYTRIVCHCHIPEMNAVARPSCFECQLILQVPPGAVINILDVIHILTGFGSSQNEIFPSSESRYVQLQIFSSSRYPSTFNCLYFSPKLILFLKHDPHPFFDSSLYCLRGFLMALALQVMGLFIYSM